MSQVEMRSLFAKALIGAGAVSVMATVAVVLFLTAGGKSSRAGQTLLVLVPDQASGEASRPTQVIMVTPRQQLVQASPAPAVLVAPKSGYDTALRVLGPGGIEFSPEQKPSVDGETDAWGGSQASRAILRAIPPEAYTYDW